VEYLHVLCMVVFYNISFKHDMAANQYILLFVSHRVTLNMRSNCVFCSTAHRL